MWRGSREKGRTARRGIRNVKKTTDIKEREKSLRTEIVQRVEDGEKFDARKKAPTKKKAGFAAGRGLEREEACTGRAESWSFFRVRAGKALRGFRYSGERYRVKSKGKTSGLILTQ